MERMMRLRGWRCALNPARHIRVISSSLSSALQADGGSNRAAKAKWGLSLALLDKGDHVITRGGIQQCVTQSLQIVRGESA